MSTTTRPAPTGRSLLCHDMTPVDPLQLPKRHSNYFYEPSTGTPTRDFRVKAHGVQGQDGSQFMLDQPARVQKMAEESSRTPPQVRRTKHNFEPGVAKEPPEFHEGKHTTPYAKVNPLGMKTMFDTTDHATKRMMEMKLLDRSVSDANWQMAQARRAQRRPRDSLPAPTGLASDPWDDRKPLMRVDDRRPLKNDVARGKIFETGTDEFFSTRTSRRGGAGAPLRNSKGEIVARPIKPKPTQTEPNDNSYVARYFGKPGAGSALRTADGQPLAKLEGRVGTYAIHHDGPVGELVSYMGRVGPGGAPCRSNSGTIHAEHKSDVDLDRHHHIGPADPFLDKAFSNYKFKERAGRHDLLKELTRSHINGPPIFLDRAKDAQPPSKPLPIRRDAEFAGRVKHETGKADNTGATVLHK